MYSAENLEGHVFHWGHWHYPFWWCLHLGVEFTLETKFSSDVMEW